LQAITAILDRWGRHAAVETVWRTVQNETPPAHALTAEEFIYLVLFGMPWLEKVQQIVLEGPGVLAKARAQAKKDWRQKQYFPAATKSELADHHESLAIRVLGRKRGTAARKIFIKAWRDKFRGICGQPLDDVVRVLTEVVFDCEMTIDAIRSTGKATTKAKRSRDIRSLK
jgi:hypothetical protein